MSPRLALAALVAAAVLRGDDARANVETEEYWAELGVRLVPVRRLRLTVSNSARVAGIYGLRRVIPELEVDYRAHRMLRVGLGYRYVWRRDALGEVDEGHRLHAEVTGQLSLRRVDIELRSRVQWRTVAEVNHGVANDDDRSMWRNRLNVEWGFVKRLSVNAFVEHWTRLDTGFTHDRLRVGAGLAVDVAQWRFHAYYQRDLAQFIDEPNVNMVGLSARFTMDFTRP